MSPINQAQIKQTIGESLEAGEELLSIGSFKKIPPTSWLLLTRGFAYLLAPRFYVGVTDRRMIILPESSLNAFDKGTMTAGFDQVSLTSDLFNNTVLDIQKTYQGVPLQLRFSSSQKFEGIDQFDFIAAVKKGQG
jgi:hypothetical protein